MIGRMRPDQGVDPQRIYVVGISGGAVMSLALPSAYPEVFSARASLASSFPLAGSGRLGTTATASRGWGRNASQKLRSAASGFQ
jgi:poly(3-hydroxybutyrate) depolymerase